MQCLKCHSQIPEARSNLGFTTCVNCSSTVRYSCVEVNGHKTGRYVQPIRDPEVARHINSLGRRSTFGPARGIMPTTIPSQVFGTIPKDDTKQKADSSGIVTRTVKNSHYRD